MFEDEMTEAHVARGDREYRRITEWEIKAEELARAYCVALALRAQAHAIIENRLKNLYG